MIDEAEMLRTQVRALTAENQALRKSLRDEFAKAALTGLIANAELIYLAGLGENAYAIADRALAAREHP